MEQNAVHPIAKAIIAYAAEEKVMPMELDKYLSVPGYGLEASFQHNGQPVQAYIGRLEYLAPYLPPETLSTVKEKIRQRKEFGELLAVFLMDSTVFLFRFSDTIRPRMRETIAELKRSGKWRLLMLTGDHMVSARKIANELGLDEFHAELLPEHKLQYVTKLSNSIGLAMVGDGVNDAPALARATVGICMGKVGSATAIDASDVVLLHDDLTLLNWLMNKADQTQRIVKQNLAVATLAIIVASSSALLGIIPLWAAVVMHEGGTVLVGLNALRLLSTARP
jgi:P-type E1-E2 ATPase